MADGLQRPPTPQGISRLLAKAGFTRSVSRVYLVKGWHDWNEGFRVNGYGRDSVMVQHRLGKFARGELADDRQETFYEKYTEAITAAGYAVTPGVFGRLIVTALETRSEEKEHG